MRVGVTFRCTGGGERRGVHARCCLGVATRSHAVACFGGCAWDGCSGEGSGCRGTESTRDAWLEPKGAA